MTIYNQKDINPLGVLAAYVYYILASVKELFKPRANQISEQSK